MIEASALVCLKLATPLSFKFARSFDQIWGERKKKTEIDSIPFVSF